MISKAMMRKNVYVKFGTPDMNGIKIICVLLNIVTIYRQHTTSRATWRKNVFTEFGKPEMNGIKIISIQFGPVDRWLRVGESDPQDQRAYHL
jgi:hypothetical protein